MGNGLVVVGSRSGWIGAVALGRAATGTAVLALLSFYGSYHIFCLKI